MDEDPEPNLCRIEIGSYHINSYMIPQRVSLPLYLAQCTLYKGYCV